MRIKAQEPAPVIIESETVFNESVIETNVEETASCTSKEVKTSNIVLVILGVFLLGFITTMIVIFCVKGSVPDTLIQYTMGAGGMEALLLAGIKVSKVLTEGKSTSDPPDGVG